MLTPAPRQSKRQRILNFFARNLGKRYGTSYCHGIFGPSFRTRVSEINRDPDTPIRILNETVSADDGEASVYRGEMRLRHAEACSLFGDLAPEPVRWRDPEER